MAIAYKSQGAGVSTQTSGAALSPACPATVDAGDVLIAHVFWEGTATSPSTPGDWTLLHGPEVIESTIAQHWVFGKVADGTEDGGTVAFGSPAVTTQRAARIYSFSGRVSGGIADLVTGFSATSHGTDPQMPSVTTTEAGNLAVALIAQNDNNTAGNATGESGGDWTEAVAEYTAALTPGLMLQIQICVPTADPGTVSGGSVATTNDRCGVIGFQIRQQLAAFSMVADSTAFTVTGTDVSLEAGFEVSAENGVIALTGTDAALVLGRALVADSESFVLTGTDTALNYGRVMLAETAPVALTGSDASLHRGFAVVAETTTFALTGTDAALETGHLLAAESAAHSITGTDAALLKQSAVVAEAGSFTVVGTDVSTEFGRAFAAETGAFVLTGTDATLTLSAWDNRPRRRAISAQAWA